MQLLSDVLTLDWVNGLDWALPRLLPLKGLPYLTLPQRLGGFYPWGTPCKVAVSKQGITVRSSFDVLKNSQS